MKKLYYFLLATQVLYRREKLERTRNFNILVTSETNTINRRQLGRAQQQAQVRYFTEHDTEKTSEVIDVFMMGVGHLGQMTEAEFHEGFDYEGKPKPVDPDEPVDSEDSTELVTEAPAAANDPAPVATKDVDEERLSNGTDPRYGTDDAGKQQDREG